MGDINKSIHKNVLKAVLYVYYMHMLKFQCNWSNNFLTAFEVVIARKNGNGRKMHLN